MVHEDNDALTRVDHFSEGRPLSGEVSTRSFNSGRGHKDVGMLTLLRCICGDGGVYAKSATPDCLNSESQTERLTPSGFVKRRVRTSFGLARSHLWTVLR